jgi:hypothetical protein
MNKHFEHWLAEQKYNMAVSYRLIEGEVKCERKSKIYDDERYMPWDWTSLLKHLKNYEPRIF